MVVDVAGAVLRPGVYQLERGSVVADAIAAAGGPAVGADLDRLNKAVRLQDGMQVYVPRIGQTAPTQLIPTAAPTQPVPVAAPIATAQTGKQPSGPVDINTATLEQLDTLPGIGPALAQRIIAGRPYSRIEDIMRVPGIGQATFDKLRTLITVQ
jgi:competence protein ComEA